MSWAFCICKRFVFKTHDFNFLNLSSHDSIQFLHKHRAHSIKNHILFSISIKSDNWNFMKIHITLKEELQTRSENYLLDIFTQIKLIQQRVCTINFITEDLKHHYWSQWEVIELLSDLESSQNHDHALNMCVSRVKMSFINERCQCLRDAAELSNFDN